MGRLIQERIELLNGRQSRNRAALRGGQCADGVGAAANLAQCSFISQGVGVLLQARQQARDKAVARAGGVDGGYFKTADFAVELGREVMAAVFAQSYHE